MIMPLFLCLSKELHLEIGIDPTWKVLKQTSCWTFVIQTHSVPTVKANGSILPRSALVWQPGNLAACQVTISSCCFGTFHGRAFLFSKRVLNSGKISVCQNRWSSEDSCLIKCRFSLNSLKRHIDNAERIVGFGLWPVLDLPLPKG